MGYKLILIKEKVVIGLATNKVTKNKTPILYSVPEFLEKSDAEVLIDIIENNPELFKIIGNHEADTPKPQETSEEKKNRRTEREKEWNRFWDILLGNPRAAEILKSYGNQIENLKQYHLSRLKPGLENDDFSRYDNWVHSWAKTNLGKGWFPSFQEWWTLSASKPIPPGARSLEDVLKNPKTFGYQSHATSGVALGTRALV